jgi:hypothetical protein
MPRPSGVFTLGHPESSLVFKTGTIMHGLAEDLYVLPHADEVGAQLVESSDSGLTFPHPKPFNC